MTMRHASGVRQSMGLRARSAAAFAVLALLLSSMLAILTYEVARRYLLDQRESLATRQAFVNARAITGELPAAQGDLGALLAGLPSTSRSTATLRVGSEWFSASVPGGSESIPKSLISITDAGNAARQRISQGPDKAIMIGIPIPGESETTYFESFSLAELDNTLGTLTRSLAVGAVVSTLAGALIGRAASRRVVAPLREVATAAEQIAQGDFRTRLDPRGDRDLAPLLYSFNDMAAAVSERLAREERFASDVSHELRTPLTALAAAASVLERRVAPETMPALDVLKAQINRFQRLVLDLLEISRYDAGAEQLERVAVEPGDLLGHVLATSGRPVSLLDLGESIPARIAVDPRRVEQMLANLMDNADLYGGGVVRVAVEVESGMIRFTVDDEGQGVPVEERERIFERFYRGSGRAAGDTGSGLGLALVAEHCRLHGGRVRVEDGPKGGARFVVELPVDA